jgi:hypothetical protein
MTKQQQILQAARLWLSESDRDVAEIRLDDLLNPDADDAIESICSCSAIKSAGIRAMVVVTQESGTVTRIPL